MPARLPAAFRQAHPVRTLRTPCGAYTRWQFDQGCARSHTLGTQLATQSTGDARSSPTDPIRTPAARTPCTQNGGRRTSTGPRITCTYIFGGVLPLRSRTSKRQTYVQLSITLDSAPVWNPLSSSRRCVQWLTGDASLRCPMPRGEQIKPLTCKQANL